MKPTTTRLAGFTAHTRPWLCGVLRDAGWEYAHHQVEGYWVIDLERRHALALVNRLKDTPDEHFPGGKWATIQCMEACIVL